MSNHAILHAPKHPPAATLRGAVQALGGSNESSIVDTTAALGFRLSVEQSLADFFVGSAKESTTNSGNIGVHLQILLTCYQYSGS